MQFQLTQLDFPSVLIRPSGYDPTNPVVYFLIVVTALEACSDATGSAPSTFPNRIVGFYIATLFVVWQIVNFAVFGMLPAMSLLVGSVLIVSSAAASLHFGAVNESHLSCWSRFRFQHLTSFALRGRRVRYRLLSRLRCSQQHPLLIPAHR